MARYALVIGISEYNDSLVPNLSKTASDAKAIAALLKQSNTFQKVTVLTGTVNQQNFVQALKQLLQEANKNEALIYYTGHGITQLIEDEFGQQERQGHLVFSDSRITLNPQGECISISSSIPLAKFNNVIQTSHLSNLVVLLDCCHSEYVLERGLLERLTAFSTNTDYYFVAACRTTEAARAKKSEQHSVFTGALLAALAAENADEDGVVTGDRVFDSLYRSLRGMGQEPIRMGWGRSIPIVRYPEQRLEPEALFNPTNPYVGLAAFELSQKDYFFGREQAIRELLDRLPKARFLAVTGSSGCGKSSLVKAGLLPELASDRPIATITPGSEPLETWQKLLHHYQTPQPPLVLLIDQFEELFTLCQDAEKQQAFIQHLVAEATQADRTTQIILTIRNDFLDRCAKFPEVATLINSKEPPKLYLVPELSLAELQAAIVKPALRHGVTFTEGLAADIAAEVVDQRGALPLLQYALTKLWDACISENSPDRLLTREAYEQIGGVNGALRDTANLLYDTSSSTEQPLIRKLMLELVRVNDDQSRTRRRVSRDRLEKVVAPIAQLQPILDKLTRNRLIVLDEKSIEVTHEALLTEWTLLDSWIKAEQEQIYLRDQVEACYKDWQERYQRSSDALLSGALLAAVEEKLNWKQLPEAEFVQQSIEHRDRSVKAQLRKQRQFFLLASAFLMSIVAGAFIYAQARGKEATYAYLQQVKSFTSLSHSYYQDHQQLEALESSIYALNILSKKNLDSSEFLETLGQVVDGVQERNRWLAHSNRIYALSFNQNLNSEQAFNKKIAAIASGGTDGLIKLWDIKGELIKSWDSHQGSVWSLAFSPNGKLLASTGFDNQVHLWDIPSGQTKGVLSGFKNQTLDITFSNDSSLLAASSLDGKIKVWDVNTKRELKTLVVQHPIFGITFHPKNRNLIAFGGQGDNNRIRIWNWNSKSEADYIIGQHESGVFQVKLDPSGQILASCSGDGVIKIWFISVLSQPKLVAKLKAHDQNVFGLGFNHDGKLLVSSSGDQTIKVWDVSALYGEYKSTQKPVEAQQPLITIKGHTSDIVRTEFVFFKNSNKIQDELIISTGNDKTIRVWDWKAGLKHYEDNSKDLNSLYAKACYLIQVYKDSDQLSKELREVCS